MLAGPFFRTPDLGRYEPGYEEKRLILELSTWLEITDWLKRSRTILIPIGSMEQHGPNGYIGTDAICPSVIARAAESASPDSILVGPTFSVGCAQHHLGFPGTISLRPSTMVAAMVDWTQSLRCHGFRRFYWYNGHGGNIATINAAFSEIHAIRSFQTDGDSLPGLDMKLVNWWDFARVAELCEQLYPQGHGSHATASEVSVTYAAYPDYQKTDVAMSPKIAPTGNFGDAYQYREKFPDGRIGSDPSLSNAEDGRQIIEVAAAELQSDYRSFAR